MILAAAALAGAITSRPVIRLRSDAIRLGEAVDLRGGAARLGDIVIARLPVGTSETALTRAQLASLANRAVPGLKVTAGEGSVRFMARAPLETFKRECLEAAAAIAAGSAVSPADVIDTACDDKKTKAQLRYDGTDGTAIAVNAIAAGDYLGTAHIAAKPAVERGDKLTLQSRSGPVTIERSVVAMQPARASDSKIFVRDEDGQVFASAVKLEKGR